MVPARARFAVSPLLPIRLRPARVILFLPRAVSRGTAGRYEGSRGVRFVITIFLRRKHYQMRNLHRVWRDIALQLNQ